MATNLSSFVQQAVAHEDTPAPIDHRLRVGGFVGMGLLAAFAVFLWVGWHQLARSGAISLDIWFGSDVVKACFTLGGHAELVFKFVVGALLLSLGLCGLTRGFQQARMAGQFGVYGVHVAGFLAAVPMVVAALTIAAFITLVVIGLVVGFFILAAALDGL